MIWRGMYEIESENKSEIKNYVKIKMSVITIKKASKTK